MLPLLLCATALGQAIATDRPLVPSAGLAAEGGPGMMWVNPANMAFDPDRRYGVYVSQDLAEPNTSVAATAGVGGLSVGVHNVVRPDGATDWSLDYGTSLPLPERLAVGWRIDWHLVEGGRNYVAYDVGATWRPLPWFGVAAVGYNIGTPDENAPARSGAGLAIRPFQNTVLIGADFLHTFPLEDGSDGVDSYRLSARVRPVAGLYLRGSIDDQMRIGAGLEVYFGGFGAGGHGVVVDDELGVTAFVGTDEPGESLVRSGRRASSVDLRTAPPYEPRTGLFITPETSWLDTLEQLRRLEDDRGIKAVLVALGDAPLSFAQLRELRDQLARLQADGKKVVVYLHGSPGNGAYYAASIADRVVLHPAGEVGLIGLSAEIQHFRGSMDLLGVEPQFVRRSEFKSAAETFTESEPSGPSLLQTEALLDDLDAELVTAIATGRQRTEDKVREWVDGGPWTAREALELGLVDALLYPDELDEDLEYRLDGPVKVSTLDDLPQPHSAWEAPQQIAVIYVDSVIVSGPSSDGGLLGGKTSGSSTIVGMLDSAREDPRVRAVVMRVDSPGGSAFASDEIWRAVERVKQSDKPIVVSMGGVAASGGYYISAGADHIWAEPSTITGSIGVVSGKFDVSGLQERLGIHTTVLERGRHATIHSSVDRWDDRELARMEALVEDVYDQFTDKVAAGRAMTDEEVEAIAKGRVWSGRRAHELGLVDELGGLPDAIADARRLAGIPEKRKIALVSYSRSGTPFESLSPALIRLMGPLPQLIRRPTPPPAPSTLPAAVTEALRPLTIGATLAEESLWLIEPALLGLELR